ncbi:M48 family metallopeptidase [Actomonas aquatica]|uniref:SprT family zinc-dependent metalloprotease n=1 Tax=Actomonas aquatica TaxID=2866162 RepID=A0ABZ1C203_9BACT|nr:SprT family zinc-dependent metalloprotease [Opitutus sp. WL0086]WRQ85555.1 SprT family zinc-dependent metalloprotease [Opitutus sp. WL0086]
MDANLQLGDVTITVRRKPIKNLHLSAHPPTGRVTISAPERMRFDRIRLFAISKLDWIKRQQGTLRAQERETPRDFVERESHYVWGRRYLMSVEETEGGSFVELHPRRIVLGVRSGTTADIRRAILERWYRDQIRAAVPEFIRKWEPILDVAVKEFFVCRMKTKWGSCSPERRNIRLNTELAKKPKECLEYVIVHEMVHLLEPTHGPRFQELMNCHLGSWRSTRGLLNNLPIH